MTILLDVGNSRFKWSTLSNGVLSDIFSQEHEGQERAQTVVTALQSSKAARRIVVACVLADDFKKAFTHLARACLDVEPEFIIPERSAYGIRVAYANPKAFGADRFAALIAARQELRQPCIVVDCGTAVTIDALTPDGEHLGGLILPGLDLMRRSLIEHTARINVGIDKYDDGLFGRSTSHAVEVGTLRGLVGAIDRIVEEMTACLSERGQGEVQRIMTGGAGASLLPHLAASYRLEPRLVLQGLAIIAEANKT